MESSLIYAPEKFTVNRIWYRAAIILTIGVLAFGSMNVRAQPASTLLDWLSAYCPDCLSKSSRRTGVYVLESGENALLARAWLTERAQATIDVQYFIRDQHGDKSHLRKVTAAVEKSATTLQCAD